MKCRRYEVIGLGYDHNIELTCDREHHSDDEMHMTEMMGGDVIWWFSAPAGGAAARIPSERAR